MTERCLSRREFGKLAGVSMAATAMTSSRAAQPGTTALSPPVYRGTNARCVAMPLGGIGAGHYCIAGDGSLRQWQIFNIPNHQAFIPGTFFAVRVNSSNFTAGRLLQTGNYYDDPDFVPAPSVSDHEIPPQMMDLMDHVQGVEDVEFIGEYPIARLRYVDSSLPVEITCEVMTPMIPLDPDFSGLPAAIYRFTVRRIGVKHPIHVALLSSLQNAVGYDGVSLISGVENHGYGGNLNSEVMLGELNAIYMTNTWLSEDDANNGSMVLGARANVARRVETYTGWDDPERFMGDFFRSERKFRGYTRGTSERGRTWNASLVQRFTLSDDEPHPCTFYHAWHIPNYYINWRNTNPGGPGDRSKFWVGKHYSLRYSNALDVAQDVVAREEILWNRTAAYRDRFYRSNLPQELVARVGSQTSIIRSPTTFWDDRGRFFGFEGCNGASANWISMVGGCCPLNCTHVWHYEQALAYLFPSLERSMRETELFVQQSPEGFIQHRVLLPLYAPRNWEDLQEGPRGPALDGMLSIILRSYREIRQMIESTWLERAWPHVASLMEHCIAKFDTNRTGVIEGRQPNTYDISVYGPNTFIGSLYLAALRAAEEMAERCGESQKASGYREIFERGRESYDRLCWNGEYYFQMIRTPDEAENSYGTGCHSDQLVGQWWAHMLDLGYVLPTEHVRTAVSSIVRYNLRRGFSDFHHQERVFADRSDAGLLMASWPQGGRPEKPTRYCDEVWTGIEYEVAALCLYEGLNQEAEEIVRAVAGRYDGSRRNPWNEIECGDHYARAMSSYGVLLAALGFYYDGPRGLLTFGPRLASEDCRAFYTAGTAWGGYVQRIQGKRLVAEIEVDGGYLEIKTLRLKYAEKGLPAVTATSAELPLTPGIAREKDYVTLDFGERLTLQAGESLKIGLG